MEVRAMRPVTLLSLAMLILTLVGNGVLIREYLVWTRAKRQGNAASTFMEYLAPSRFQALIGWGLTVLVGLFGTAQLTDSFTRWPKGLATWIGLSLAVLYALGGIALGVYHYKMATRLQKTGEPLTDERVKAIGVHAGNSTMQVISLLLGIRVMVEYTMQTVEMDAPPATFEFLATNTSSQTLFALALIAAISVKVHERRMG
jgi:uncharacterized membrane protein